LDAAGGAPAGAFHRTGKREIANCRFSFTGVVAVFDDLTWNPPVPVELMQFGVE
jgi:hypothetical protein